MMNSPMRNWPSGNPSTISCYEQDGGLVHGLIDTDVPAICEWAESMYASFEIDSQPVNPEAYIE